MKNKEVFIRIIATFVLILFTIIGSYFITSHSEEPEFVGLFDDGGKYDNVVDYVKAVPGYSPNINVAGKEYPSIILSIEYSSDGKEIGRYEYEYNKEGSICRYYNAERELIQTEYYDLDGRVIKDESRENVTVFEYNDKGDRIRDGDIIYYYEYDDGGNILSVKTEGSTSSFRIDRNEEGYLMSERTDNGGYFEMSFDSRWRILSFYLNDSFGRIDEEYKFDSRGNKVYELFKYYDKEYSQYLVNETYNCVNIYSDGVVLKYEK